MAQAWLDSLSEDWVSQPPSDPLSANAPPSADNSVNYDTSAPPAQKLTGSRVPRLPQAKTPRSPTRDSSAALSERSLNDINIPGSRRGPSKLSQEIKVPEQRGRYASKSFSNSTSNNSVVHNTVNHKASSASPIRTKGQTPEWKRRLVHGELSYGEQPDLFTSAAGTGLENIFKPPTAAPKQAVEESSEEDDASFQQEVTLPSSPPMYHRDPSTVEIHVDESAVDYLPELSERRAPTAMRYRRTDSSDGPSSHSDQSAPPDSYSQIGHSGEGSILRHPHHSGDEVDVRKVSGQTMLNEDFSPIPLARHNGEDGRTTFAPDVPPSELRKRLEKLRRGQLRLKAEDDDAMDESGRYVDDSEDYEKLGAFINVRRGGRSADGSFRNRILSSALNDTSELHPEESLQASTPKQFPTVRMEQWEGTGQNQLLTPPLPRAPRPSPAKRDQSQGSNGSPLKLFQPYDTFTNKTLLRRLSQFEGQVSEESISVVRQAADTDSLRSCPDDTAVGDQLCASEGGEDEQENDDRRHSSASIGQFGVGALDGYEFNNEISVDTSSGSDEAEDDGKHQQPDDLAQRPPHVPIFNVSHQSSPPEVEEMVVPRRRKKSVSSTSSKRMSRLASISTQNPPSRASLHLPTGDQALSTPKRRQITSEGKRPRTSPVKDPTPKRRRTLHKSDIAYAAVDQSSALESVQLTHLQMQSIIGKKRKDARHGDLQQPANPNVLAMRQMLRPRTPTPSQRSSVQRDRVPSGEEEDQVFDQSQDEPPHAYTAPVAFPVGTPLDTDRKPSIKTEDFINEANKIMAMIRSKAGLGSGLASVEESESENQQQGRDDEDSFQESTKEPFSRPPSREGRPPLPRMSTRQEDPEIAERLKQYEEASDMGDMIASMRSMGLTQSSMPDAVKRHDEVQVSPGHTSTGPYMTEDEVISDPPGIRLSRAPNHSARKSNESLRDGFLSTGSNGSSGNSTNRTIPTGSSRGSTANRKTIPPESVEHLIPDQVGSMVLDRQRNIWIKRKQAGSVRSRKSFLFSEGSEDDPFADIPDLSVDMTQEMRNLAIRNAQKAEEARLAELESNKARENPTTSSPPKGSVRRPASGPSPLRTIIVQDDVSTNESPSKTVDASVQEVQVEEAVEHEIGIDEGRLVTPRKRNLTITFSSPIASVIQDIAGDETSTAADETSFAGKSAGDVSFDSSQRGRRKVSAKVKGMKRTPRSRSGSRLPARQLSVRGESFVPRPVSRIEERDEETDVKNGSHRGYSKNLEVSIVGENSLVQYKGEDLRRTSLSFVLTTPARPKDCPADGVDAGNVIAEYVGNLSLSPLSDFTIHHPDQSLPLEVSYVLGNHHLATGDPSKRVMSMNTKSLVEKLAEIEPFEPYWEDMVELDIQEKQLESLDQLDQFCDKLVTLDASKNDIRNLSGVPPSVRQLRITDNHLSSLTSWAHLRNLQYVDISNNELTSLGAFKDLVHLRSLRADNNKLTSLEGIKYHDGLQILRARGNALEDIDFDNTTLHRLTELDIRGNKIKRLDNLVQLTALITLFVDGNELDSLPMSTEKPLISLKYLSLSDNNIQTIDLKAVPALRLLHADRNRLASLTGFSRARRLDSLSLREQRIDGALDLSFLSGAYEVRKLYLSGNLLSSFDPQVDFLNLQLLELANCGLAELPPHLGQLMPNLRVVNLNSNALSDLSPLEYVPRLKRVLAAGNRIASASDAVRVLSGFPHLQTVDLRDNPVTQGFYAPVRVVVRRGEADAVTDMFTLPDQDAETDARYSSRLDLETRVRRRIYESVFVEACGKLKVLDGLPVRKDIGKLRDAVWVALAARELVVNDDGSKIDVSTVEKEMSSACWEGEDSFA
ncbi:Wd repeat domain-containing protein [Coniochaeta hoffmannii]|uniref:Wd repeat domain-containing protein n=1 Tax=Coniochaeta hoffmannii TaxID=91930 RepID=A0AA38VLG5_9PEZI|nr:Wd repeat domain-containing protein [Coniochaeta hoffmannii]